ncbi:MAG: SUMF1/EgtB/PvdO family nonheme iron enzyme [candidate division KSB1 bacterium]|nr:SUMF1/EgtB/PvdO family nonheme iron enzyme [candidate division KSB1 bacterium]
MLNQIPEKLKTSTEDVVSIVDWFSRVLREKHWVTRLLLVDVLLFAVFNPIFFTKILQLFTTKAKLPEQYPLFFWLVITGVFIVALIAALRTRPTKTAVSLSDSTKRSAIKGLRPFRFEDAELFVRLQREESLRECLEAITDRDFRFGVLCGESGCGKTSFLQAGLWPRLMAQKTPHRCVYVQFSDVDPMDLLRHEFTRELQLPKAQIAQADFLALLEAALSTDSKPLVLLFDQFEQFFVHRKTKEARKPFVQALAHWYTKRPPLPVKILLCVRGDYSDRLIELQKAMGYSLGVHNYFRLEKFTPKEATEVFRVIAETEGFSFNESFVNELTEQELADRDDGRISPVDLQILAWMIRGQTSAEERALNRATYQKLGGIEGLLEKFLSCELEARETEARRQAALKVLLGLTDLEHGVRAGVLTVTDLQQKLAGTVSESEVRDAVEWLGRGDIRLITPSQRDGALGYELAHERLIPALRRLAGKELSEVDQANELLERRVNEWLGNDRDPRYLLRWRELRRIRQQQPYLVWGKREIQKRELLRQSRRRFQWHLAWSLVALLFLVLAGSSWSWFRHTLEQQQLEARRQQLYSLLSHTDMPAQRRVAQVHELTQKHGDPRAEVTTLEKMQFCYVPPGPFWMGSDTLGDEDEKPLHLNEHLDYGFWISRFPITVAQFKIFANDSGTKIENLTFQDDPDNRPVRYVTWYQAMRFCDWLTDKWIKENRLPQNWRVILPSEAEWEKAARGGIEILSKPIIHTIGEINFDSSLAAMLQKNPVPQRLYPWGNQPDANLANYYDTNIGNTSAVGCFPGGASPYGCEEMAGNVWEWTRSLWGVFWQDPKFKYPYNPNDGRENLEASLDIARVLRGASFLDDVRYVRCAARGRNNPDDRGRYIGFRVVVLSRAHYSGL